MGPRCAMWSEVLEFEQADGLLDLHSLQDHKGCALRMEALLQGRKCSFLPGVAFNGLSWLWAGIRPEERLEKLSVKVSSRDGRLLFEAKWIMHWNNIQNNQSRQTISQSSTHLTFQSRNKQKGGWINHRKNQDNRTFPLSIILHSCLSCSCDQLSHSLYSHNIIMSLCKVQDSSQKHSSFISKFEGKVNKVPRLGINAVLLKQEFDDLVVPKDFLGRAKIIKSMVQQQHDDRLKALPSVVFSTPQKKQKSEGNNMASDESKLLRRHPSQKLPLIYRSSEISREPSIGSLVKQKVKSEENGKASGGSKYRSWKYPPRLSQQALRFFAFAEGDANTQLKSARN